MTIERKTEIEAFMPHMATLKEASELTPFSYYALRKMCLENKIACIRSSGKFYINMDALARLLNGGGNNE